MPVPLAEALAGHAGRCFGVFRNPREAQRLLATFADSYKLCCKRLGLGAAQWPPLFCPFFWGVAAEPVWGGKGAAQFNTRLESVCWRAMPCPRGRLTMHWPLSSRTW